MKKSFFLFFLALIPIATFSQQIEIYDEYRVPIQKISDTSFYSAIDTLLFMESEQGIVRDSSCAIIVNVHQKGLIQMISLKNNLCTAICESQQLKEDEKIVTSYKGRLVFVIFFGINSSEWVKDTGRDFLLVPCSKQETDKIGDIEGYDYSCIVLSGIHRDKRIWIVDKSIMEYSKLAE